ncbi:class I SAM-dependent methyltransferase [Rugosimonospora africana]|uniref:Methyltransferase n=1 Tax=Rugosimonospora africana TaxID=556532 RepID=A0A8J3VQN5_9ACTN|nr:class I SAM-dependent methyltransferase [Rugosimonospora africana]GIH15309.1 methyltransferase [Rugosimonospora africana]
MDTIANTEQARAWNGYEGQYWADHPEHWDGVAGALNTPLFGAAGIDPADRVLDIACGNGQTTRLAAGLASRGHALGVDLSGPMVATARAIAAAEGIANVRFEHGDAQVYPLPHGEFDVAISRGGMTYFIDPVAAFVNVGSALRPGGQLAFVCLREAAEQEWFTVFTSALLGRTPTPNAADPYAPGMFSLTDAERIRDVLGRAGFADITVTPVEVPMLYGPDASRAAEMRLGSGPARDRLRDADQATQARALQAVTAALRPFEQADGVRLRGAYWLVGAVRPGQP